MGLTQKRIWKYRGEEVTDEEGWQRQDSELVIEEKAKGGVFMISYLEK